MNSHTYYRTTAYLVLTLATAAKASAAESLRALHGHVPTLPPGLIAKGELPATNHLRLAIGIPLRDPAGLDRFLAGLYDPASTNFHKYLTPEEFTARFGPTEADYQAVLAFAEKNGLTVTEKHPNRLLLDVEGPVAAINNAFHIRLLNYRHPKEERDFYAPDRDPSVDAQLPISDVSGLNNYALPHPNSRPQPLPQDGPTPKGGSSPTGSYMGGDFRAAYLPGVTLTGAGQMIGLVQFDGFYQSDINAYATAAGLPAIPVQTVLLDGYNGVPTTGANSGNTEVSLDIEMAMSMAPGLDAIVVFEAGPAGFPNDVLNRMVSSNIIKQFSCSWGWDGGPSTTTDNIFRQMAAQGQSFFNASGDSDAFTTGASSVNGVDNPSNQNAPSSSPYITMVGGTTLNTTGPGGAWVSESVWNWGPRGSSYVGSSGGISSFYSLPSWQEGIDMTANGGSTGHRNIPDVALTADNVYVKSGNGTSGNVGGTSCAAPLWAGLTALINQQAVSAGKSPVGFLNPSLYNIGRAASYNTSFHDITTGDNFSGSSPSLFSAATGYDLCTGWGTPAGQALIDALSGAANALSFLPSAAFTASGPTAGPFTPASQSFTLTNAGLSAIDWSADNATSWLTISPAGGTLAGASSVQLSVSFTPSAATLTDGVYHASIVITNYGGGALLVPVTLNVGQPLVQNGGFETGDFTGWTLIGNGVNGSTIYNAVESTSSPYDVAHSGNFGAFLGDTQFATLSQTLATTAGQYYRLSLWLNNPSAGSVQRFAVNWNTNASNNTLISMLNPPAFSWTNLQFLVRAGGPATTVQILAENDPNYFGLDDISVTPVQVAATGTLAISGNDVQLSWTTTVGVTYQSQYTTSLTQPQWINMGSPFKATDILSTLLDRNALSSASARFYRLIAAP